MSLPPALHTYLSNVGRAYKARDREPHLLIDAVRQDIAAHNELRSALRATPGKDVGRTVTSQTGIKDSERLHAFLVALLEYVEQHDSVRLLTTNKGSASTASAQTYAEAYAAWAQVYSRATLVFQAQETSYFGATLRYVGTTFVLLAIAADARSRDQAQPCISDAVSKVSRTAGSAAIDRTPLPGEQTRRSEVLWLANASFRCYFKLNNIRLCETVLGSVENALTLNKSFASAEQKEAVAGSGGDATALGMACYNRADRVAYRYYLGRLRLSQQRIRAAYVELRWAFDNCTNAHMHNKNLILTHLVVAAIILGVYPCVALLQASRLDGPFATLIQRIRCGDGRGMYEELDRWRDWHRSRGHYLLLREKLEIGAWRNLMRKSFLVARFASGLGHPSALPLEATTPAKTPPPVLKLATFLLLARKAWHDSDLGIDDVECVVASLIDQGYVKAYAMHSSGNVVFRRTPDFGFVKMSTVY